MTFGELCECEPRLRALADEILTLRDDGAAPYFCANELWYGEGPGAGVGFKARMSFLVGFKAGAANGLVGAVGTRESGFTGLGRLLIPSLGEMPGLGSVDPRLATCDAYDCAYRALYEMLPACRGACGCAATTEVLGF